MNDTPNPLLDLLSRKGCLLTDGATGTMLFDAGLEAGAAPELWNVDNVEAIESLHRGFVEAGSDIILTNSFGGTRHRLKLHNAEERVFELNKRAAEIACSVAKEADREIIVAGSVGPTGELLEPLGALSYEDCCQSFVEQMEGLKAGGAHVLWIETMSSKDEINAASQAAAKVGMPYVITASFDTAGRTMMGLPPRDLPSLITGKNKPVAVGANCGVGASDLLSSILDMTTSDPNAIIIAKANCGIPEIRGDVVEYTGTPELMGEYTRMAMDAGAKIIGGCCGTTCEHLASMRQAMDTHTRSERPTLESVESVIGPLVNKPATTDDATAQPARGGRRRRRA